MITIRTAVLADAKGMSRVHSQTWKVAYKGIFSQRYLQKLQDSNWENSFKRGIQANKQIFLVAEVKQEIVGCIIGGKSRWENSNKGEIYSLYVLPTFQAQGIGKKLVQELLRQLGSVHPIVQVLAVDKNIKARDFYEYMGFRDTEQRHHSELNGATFVSCIYERVMEL